MRKFFKEFKTFITRGNVIDLAVGMIIGAAFTAIVTALVNSIFKPLINMIPMGNLNGLITMLVAKNAEGIEVAKNAADVDMSKSIYIDWGAFIMAILNFLITAFVLFLIVKAINTMRDGGRKLKEKKAKKGQVEEPAPEPAPEPVVEAVTTEDLLREIRDLLAARNETATPETKSGDEANAPADDGK